MLSFYLAIGIFLLAALSAMLWTYGKIIMIETSLAEKEQILLGAGYQWRELSQYGESFIECKNPLLNWETVIVGEDWQLGDKERNEAISRMWTHYEAQL